MKSPWPDGDFRRWSSETLCWVSLVLAAVQGAAEADVAPATPLPPGPGGLHILLEEGSAFLYWVIDNIEQENFASVKRFPGARLCAKWWVDFISSLSNLLEGVCVTEV